MKDNTLDEYAMKLGDALSVKELILDHLLKEGHITESVHTTYSTKWNVIVVKGSWFKRWAKLFSKDKNSYYYRFVKFEN